MPLHPCTLHEEMCIRDSPYTMPISDIVGLRAAVDNVLADTEILARHARIAAATREAVMQAGLHLYLQSGYSNTVTVIEVPEGLTDKAILSTMKDKYNVMISGCFDVLAVSYTHLSASTSRTRRSCRNSKMPVIL